MPELAANSQPAEEPVLTARLLHGGILAVSRGAGVAAQMGVQIVVGALAGPSGIGVLQLHMAWGTLLGEVVGAGEPTRALRDQAVHHRNGDRTSVVSALRGSAKHIVRYSAMLLVLALLVSLTPLQNAFNVSSGPLLLSIVLSAPLFALTRLLAESLKATEQALWAVTLENTIMPVTILLLCGAIALGVFSVSSALLLAGAVAGLLLALLSLTAVLAKTLSTEPTERTTEDEIRPLRRSGELAHFWLNGLFNIAFLQLPFLLMPFMMSADQIGRYAVAHKLVNIITTLLILLAAIYGPRFARAAAEQNAACLRRLLAETQWVSLALFLPTILAMIILINPLTALFSLDPGTLLPLLALLGVGQLCNAATGLSGVLLNMSGAAHVEMRLLLVTTMLTVAGSVPLGLSYGVHGIAVGIAAGIATRNAASYIAARRHIKNLGLEHS
ncbi:MAG: sugar transporter [Pseudomonadota bacterium]